jgi:hypothetical protein
VSRKISLKDAERRINYSIQETDVIADVIEEIETGIIASDDIHALTREVAEQLHRTHEKLCELFTVIYATRLLNGIAEQSPQLTH